MVTWLEKYRDHWSRNSLHCMVLHEYLSGLEKRELGGMVCDHACMYYTLNNALEFAINTSIIQYLPGTYSPSGASSE